MKLLKKGTHVLPTPFLSPSQALISVRNAQSRGPYEMVSHILCQPQRRGGLKRVQVPWGRCVQTQLHSMGQAGKGPGIPRDPTLHIIHLYNTCT